MLEKFYERLKEIYNEEDIKIIKNAFSINKRKTSLRVNYIKSNDEEIEKFFLDNGFLFKKVSFLKWAYILENKEEKDLWGTSIFEEWKIYLQSISSQIPINLLDLKFWDKILDITASPWWKTSQVASFLKNHCEIVAVDNNAIRIDKLNFTLKRQWVKNVKVLKEDARLLWENHNEYIWYFDKIIADLPCSAEWKFNLNREKSYSYWSEWILKKNYKLQKEIIRSIIPLLKEWGELIYSTCTILPLENEDIVHFIVSNFPFMSLEEINLDYEYARDWVLKYEKKIYKKNMSNTKRILPCEETEWFFIAKFKKTLN